MMGSTDIEGSKINIATGVLSSRHFGFCFLLSSCELKASYSSSYTILSAVHASTYAIQPLSVILMIEGIFMRTYDTLTTLMEER
jgi:hypothetical protein